MSEPRYYRGGKEVTREEFLQGSAGLEEIFASGETGMGQSSAGWPMVSNSMAVHPSQRAEAIEQARRLGVPTDFNDRGQPVLRDPMHRKRLASALKFQDLSENNISRIERD